MGAGVAVGVAVGSGVLVGVGGGSVAVAAGAGGSIDPQAASATASAANAVRNRIFFTTSPLFSLSQNRAIISSLMQKSIRTRFLRLEAERIALRPSVPALSYRCVAFIIGFKPKSGTAPGRLTRQCDVR